MDKSVIIGPIMSRIEYYTNASGISSDVEKKYIKRQVDILNNDPTLPRLLYVYEKLQSFNIAMGEKRTTAKMYIEGDLKSIEEIKKRILPVENIEDKNNGRNFVHTMKPNSTTLVPMNNIDNDFSEQPQLDESGKGNNHTLTKKSHDSKAYQLYSKAA